MKRYKNLEGNSGVSFYAMDEDSIAVVFSNGAKYLYDHKKPGKRQVEKMKTLAKNGKGLSTYISRYVKDNFAAKLS